ncbi:hypothetical protein C5U48_02785 [Mycolicibacter virginiensis]|uniref:DUF2637 domain-containing protein n=1 Tax=Mycolicibacter virginiensis TaxID=1795032 RepID=A0A9X7IQW0_9MYCO|nr:DUF2637 domain-containing protein [Mycolicibacter virginiensis]PQM53749.1 hypothetical protein C5U48_02785 [Mycolicibacter virginiensis]
MSIRRYWGWTLTAAVTVSVAGNVGHALLTATPALRGYAAIAAALPPLALLTVTEGLARSVGQGVRRWAYWVGMIGAAAIAMLAFVLSFAALRDLAIALGQPAAVAAGWPLLADATIAVSSIMLLAVKPVADNHHAAVPATDAPAAPPTITSWTAASSATATTVTASPATPAAASSQPVGEAAAAVADTALTGGDAVADAGGHLTPGLHLVPGGEAAGEPADRHLAAAKAALAAGVVVKPPVPVAARALRLRAAGESQRAVAEQLGIDRSVVARLEAFAEELAEQEAVV